MSEIEDHAFDGCGSVKQITIPDTVTKIGVDAFKGAEALEKIISNTKDVSIVAEEKVTIETDYAADGSDETLPLWESPPKVAEKDRRCW